MLFCCRGCDGGPCELRIPDDEEQDPPIECPYDRDRSPRWHQIPLGRSTMPRTAIDILPGPFCEIPPNAIARATAEGGRYEIELGVRGADVLVIPVSRAAFHDAVKAMEAAGRDVAE